MTTTVEVLATAFKDAGTPFIVGHPGGESVELMEAGRQRQMRFLLMKQEVAGAMLAATWGEITGSPGGCLSTRRPGAANMVNGGAPPALHPPPLIALTDPEIARAKRPILIVGLGVFWAKASPELVQLAERIGAPVLTTPKCKGAIPEDHALRAGCIIGGLIERNLVNAADLIITVGLDAVELQPKPWPYKIPVLSLASTPSLDALVPADPEIVAELKALLAVLTQMAPEGA